MGTTPTPVTTEELYQAYLAARCPDAGILSNPCLAEQRIQLAVARALGSMDARTKRDYLPTDAELTARVGDQLADGKPSTTSPAAIRAADGPEGALYEVCYVHRLDAADGKVRVVPDHLEPVRAEHVLWCNGRPIAVSSGVGSVRMPIADQLGTKFVYAPAAGGAQ